MARPRLTDKRGKASDRRIRKQWMLRVFGNGTTAACWHCGTDLDFDTLEVDRVDAGGSYRRGNIIPACRFCNASRGTKPLIEFKTKRETVPCHYVDLGDDHWAHVNGDMSNPETAEAIKTVLAAALQRFQTKETEEDEDRAAA